MDEDVRKALDDLEDRWARKVQILEGIIMGHRVLLDALFRIEAANFVEPPKRLDELAAPIDEIAKSLQPTTQGKEHLEYFAALKEGARVHVRTVLAGAKSGFPEADLPLKAHPGSTRH